MAAPDPIMLDLPVELSTERLQMRPPRAGDGEAINAVICDSIVEIARWMPWARPTPEPQQTELWCRQAAVKYLAREQFHFVLFLKQTDTIVGVCGIHRSNWGVPLFEMGYWLGTRHCGQGYMTEGAGRLLRFAFEDLGANRMEIRCDAANERSSRVAERLGFTLDGVLRCDSRGAEKELRDTRIYSLIAADRAGSAR